MTEQRFIADVLANPHNREILSRWEQLALPDGWLVAGCLFQTVWNLAGHRRPDAHIKDYDIFYFDASDLSQQAEQSAQQRAESVVGDLGVAVEVKNQARVHLWYESYFGYPYAPLASARSGIERFLVPATCVGIRPAGGEYEVYAPYGLSMLYAGQLTRNRLVDHLPLFRDKAASYRSRWSWLTIDEADPATHEGVSP